MNGWTLRCLTMKYYLDSVNITPERRPLKGISSVLSGAFRKGNNQTFSAHGNTTMKKIIWILSRKRGEMCFSSLLYSTAMGSLLFCPQSSHRKNPPATEVDARLIFTSHCVRIQPKIKLRCEKKYQSPTNLSSGLNRGLGTRKPYHHQRVSALLGVCTALHQPFTRFSEVKTCPRSQSSEGQNS